MKKLTKILFTLAVTAVLMFSLTACKEVDKGSKIQRMKIEIEFLDASGAVVDTQTAEAKLYLNFAPKTTEHFMKLAEEGFYDGVTVSHIADNWCEFGAYTRNDGALVKKDYDYGKVEGEFKNNGLGGTRLTVTKGSLIMKRDYDVSDGSDTTPKYDTAQSSVIVMFNATDKFSVNNYCVFGMIETEDGEVYSSSEEDVDRSDLNSIGKFESIGRLKEDAEGTKTYYFEKSTSLGADSEYASVNSEYYTVSKDSNGTTHYFKGANTNSENELLGDDLELYNELYSKKTNDFLTVPYTEVRIKSITKK